MENFILIIRTAVMVKNIQSAVTYKNLRLGWATSTEAGMISPGVYELTGTEKTSLEWFENNDFRMDRGTRRKVLNAMVKFQPDEIRLV